MSLVEQTIEVIVEDISEIDYYILNLAVEEILVTLENVFTLDILIDDLEDVDVLVDLDYLGASDDGGIPGLFRGIINRPFTFVRSVVGRKKTYGQVASEITAHITTQASSPGNLTAYGTGAYGSGVYGDIVVKYGSLSFPISFGRVTSGINISKKTSVAEISLASHAVPSSQTSHAIKIRARTTSGSTGRIKAALYEGTTRRSGVNDLTSSPLANSFVEYTLAIADSDAATITNYSNLSIRFWGHDPTGVGLVFEVSRLYLQLPA